MIKVSRAAFTRDVMGHQLSLVRVVRNPLTVGAMNHALKMDYSLLCLTDYINTGIMQGNSHGFKRDLDTGYTSRFFWEKGDVVYKEDILYIIYTTSAMLVYRKED